MARPAHPGDHDPRIREHLDNCLEAEVLIPCPDRNTALHIRHKFYALIRAHRQWKTTSAPHLKNVSTKILPTARILPIRPGYTASPETFPLTLILDGRDPLTDILANATITEGASLTGSPSPVPSDGMPDEDDDVDAYDAIANRYRPRAI